MQRDTLSHIKTTFLGHAHADAMDKVVLKLHHR